MGKVKRFFKTLVYSVLFFIVGMIVLIVFMFSTEGEQIDRTGLNRGFVQQSLNIRAGAGTNYDVLKTLSPGDKFYVADTLENGWIKMILGSEDGSYSSKDESYAFVSGNYVYPMSSFDEWEEAYQKEQQRQSAEQERQRKLEAEKRYNRSESYYICKEFVKDRLKAPSTAEFPNSNEINIFETGAKKYMIKGHVDAQNSFGASIRTQYECEVQLDGETWELQHIQLFD